MIRLILALLFAILYLIIGIPVLGVEWIIAKFNKQAADLGQLRMVQWLSLIHISFYLSKMSCRFCP